jgi:hypothetical protein
MDELILHWTNPTLSADEAEWDGGAEDWRLMRAAGIWISHPRFDGISTPELLDFEIYGELVAEMLDRRASWLMRRGYVNDGSYEEFVKAVAQAESFTRYALAEAEVLVGEDLEALVDDMLLNSAARVRGRVGLGSQQGMAELKKRGYVGSGGTLTNQGALKARALWRKEGWE